MEEKIEMEEEKLRSAASMDNSYTKMLFSSNVPLIGKAWYLQVRTRTLVDMCQKIIYIYLHPYLRELWQGRTNSTVLLKQPNSLEVDRAELRKTKSAEHMGLLAPTIIIGQLSSWNLELPHDCIYRQGLALRHSDCYLRKQLGARKSLEVSQTCRGKIQNKYFYVTL